jgi:predicted secreted protein
MQNLDLSVCQEFQKLRGAQAVWRNEKRKEFKMTRFPRRKTEEARAPQGRVSSSFSAFPSYILHRLGSLLSV